MKPVARGRLTSRDREILKHIGEHGFSSGRWIRDRFWSGRDNGLEYRRLSVLKALGLIEPLMGDGARKLGYRLTKRGIACVHAAGDGAASRTEYRATYRTTFNHDHLLVGLANVFRSLAGVIEYLPEHQIRQALARKYGYEERRGNGYKVPDAIFKVQTKKRLLSVAIELELTPKSTSRYRKILRQLAVSPDFDMVFVLGTDAKRIEKIQSVLAWVRSNDPVVKIARRDNGFYFAELSSVLEDRSNAKLHGEGIAFSLAEFAS